MGRFRFLLVASLAFSVLPSQGLAAPSLEPLRLPFADWTRDFDHAGKLLLAGEWKKGEKAARGLIGQIMLRPTVGKGMVELLARSVALRAIGEAGRGDRDSAQWDAAAARALGLRPGDFNFSPYGEAGKIVSVALDPAMEENSEVLFARGPVKRAEFRSKVDPIIPQADRSRKIGGLVIIETVIDKQGAPRSPRILKSPSPRYALAALDALRQWRFAPATLEGKPVSVYYVLTISF